MRLRGLGHRADAAFSAVEVATVSTGARRPRILLIAARDGNQDQGQQCRECEGGKELHARRFSVAGQAPPATRILVSVWARVIALVTLLLATLTLAGCAGPTFVVQQYAGPMRPRESIGTLRVNGSDATRLMTLDDEDIAAPLEVDSRLHIELLLGPHRIGVANGPNAPVVPVAFAAEPGKVYRVVFADATPHVFEVDRASDAPGRDVTAP
jgi:hypothetical protein